MFNIPRHLPLLLFIQWTTVLKYDRCETCTEMLTNIASKHQDENKLAAVLQTTFSNVLSLKSFVFWFRCYWSLLSRVPFTISQIWFMYWPVDQATSHYRNQWWPSPATQFMVSLSYNELTHASLKQDGGPIANDNSAMFFCFFVKVGLKSHRSLDNGLFLIRR